MESFAAMFEESISKQEMRHGEVITAEVVGIDDNFVTVNAGLKSESLIPVEEFKNDRGEVEVTIGDFVKVAIESHRRRLSAPPSCRAIAPVVWPPGWIWKPPWKRAAWSRA
jgi:ribosomal protein S1